MSRKYGVDEAFFDVIDTEEKAYILGFTYGDGCVQDKAGRTEPFAITYLLQAADIDILEKIKGALHAGYPITRYECVSQFTHGQKVPQVRLGISSVRLAAAIAAQGVVPRKAHRTELPKVRADLEHHFWRGVFDADGWTLRYHLKANTLPYWAIGIVGQRHTMEAYAGFVHRVCPRAAATVLPSKTIWKVDVFGSTNPRVLGDALYKDAHIWLDRKRVLYEQMCGELTGRFRGGGPRPWRRHGLRWRCECGRGSRLTSKPLNRFRVLERATVHLQSGRCDGSLVQIEKVSA